MVPSSWRDQPRKAIGIHYVNLSLPMDWQGCYKCRVNNSGIGATISYRMTNHFWFYSEVDQFPGSGSSKGSGSATEGLFGVGAMWGFLNAVCARLPKRFVLEILDCY